MLTVYIVCGGVLRGNCGEELKLLVGNIIIYDVLLAGGPM